MEDTIYEYQIFLNPTKCTFIIYYTIEFLFTIKSVQHVSVPYYGTIISDTYRELRKITKQQVMVKVKFSLERSMKAQRGCRGIAILFL
jgi:hypothetical protein